MVKRVYEWTVTTTGRVFNFDARYFIGSGFWMVVGQIIAIIFGLVTTALFAHYLSEADYGIYRYLLSLAVIFSALSLTGIDQSILQTAAKKFYGFYQETVKINFSYNLAVFAAALIGASYYLFNDNNLLAIGCLLIAVLQPFVNTFQFVPAFLQGSRRFKESTILHGLRTAFVSVASLATLFISQNVLLLFTVFLVSTVISNVFSYWFYKPKTISQTPLDIFNKYLAYAKHTSVRNFISTIAFRADSVLVFTQLGAIELAFYSIALIIPEQIKGTFKNLATLLLPKYAKYNDIEQIKKNIPKRSLELLLILFAGAFLYIIFAPLLYKLLFPKYEEVIIYTQIIAFSFPAMIAVMPTSALQSQLKEKQLYIFNTVSSIIMVLTTFIGILFYGLLGAIIAKVIYRYLAALISYLVLYWNKGV